MKKNTKFTPLSIAAVKKICEEAGLVPAKTEFSFGLVGDYLIFDADIGYGLNEACAADAPVVIIYKNGAFELNQNPRVFTDRYADGSVVTGYECGWQINHISSIERFKKFFDEALEKHKQVYEQVKDSYETK